MHEISIAQSIVELAEAQARQRNASTVEEVELEIGYLAGVELQTLDFALKSVIKGTMLTNAVIVFHYITGEGCCGECNTVFPMDTLFTSCPHCGSFFINIIKGKELRMKSIVVK